jgi:sugar transferase (PEP-CTERM/EpsH1 system associated)
MSFMPPSNEEIVVLHLVLSLEIGGLETMVVNLVKKIKGDGFSPMICCLESKTDLAKTLTGYDIPVFTLGKKEGYDLSVIGKLIKILKAHPVTLLHTHNWDAHLYGTPAALFSPVRAVVHTQHSELQYRSWKNDLLRPILGRWIDQFVGVSEPSSAFARESGWVPKEKVTTFINGIDPAPFLSLDETHRVQMRQSLNIPISAPVLINVARHSLVKDHKTLIAAFAIVQSTQPVHLILVGDGPLRPNLEEIVLKEGLTQWVHFVGMRSDVAALLHAADLFVMSSLTEGTSISLLEAMSAGLPAVLTDVGGNRSVVIGGKTGLLVPSQNPQALANAITTVLEDKQLAKVMGESGREQVLRHFHSDQMVTRYKELYKTLLRQKGCPV